MRSMPHTQAKPSLAPVSLCDPGEVAVLEEFITIKEKAIAKLIRVNGNLEAIQETIWLKDYLQDFLRCDHSVVETELFWPNEVQQPFRPKLEQGPIGINLNAANLPRTLQEEHAGVNPLAHLLDVELRSYFGPNSTMPTRVSTTTRQQRVPPVATPRIEMGGSDLTGYLVSGRIA